MITWENVNNTQIANVQHQGVTYKKARISIYLCCKQTFQTF